MKTPNYNTNLTLFLAFILSSIFAALLQAEEQIDTIAVGTTGYAVQSSAFSAPDYDNYNLSAIVATDENFTILDVNPGGGFTYDGVHRGNFTKSGDGLYFESDLYATTADLYAAYPLGSTYEFNFLYNSVVRTETGTRPDAPTSYSLPVNPGYIVSALSADTNVADDGFWDNGRLVLDVAGTYTLSFSQFDSVPVFSEVLIRNPLGPDLFIEADGNLGILTIHGADLVAGTLYEGYIEIFYGDEVSGSFDPTVDFKRSITSFEIEAVPEPATYALVFGLLVAVITLLRRR
jgi:hypothetical protein